ncbi:hypothetical protein MCU23_07850 [Klebsiella quasipneumoniae]|nr:hypothetical protein [Klebsiella quasipneumoniae]MCX2315277.1 hypothetical protein [Klebsiella quasipneumoniae]HBV4138872.1 hypothetical protein [Klebsiella quasipneumoniae]
MTTDITELALITIKNQIKSFDTVVLRENEALALVEALEKAQQRIGKLEKKITDHKRMNQEMAKAMLTPNDSDAAGMEIEALRQRIAGLESRTVKLPPKIERNDIDEWFMYKGGRVGGGAAEWYNKALDDVGAELTAAGIKVEAE